LTDVKSSTKVRDGTTFKGRPVDKCQEDGHKNEKNIDDNIDSVANIKSEDYIDTKDRPN
jgi:hypothetical protein